MSGEGKAILAGPEKGEAVYGGDPRFAAAWTLAPSGRRNRPLLIAVHGSLRDHLETRDAFDGLAVRKDINVFAPLFPADVVMQGYADGYKFLREPGIDYVALMDEMIAAFRAGHGVLPGDVYLFGFSGGAQFALRYAYVAAGRLSGVVVAAPGAVTLLDDGLPWWPGTAGIEEAIGHAVDQAGLRALPIHLIIGADDRDEGLVHRGPGHPNHSPYAAVAGASRRRRVEALKGNLLEAGLRPELEVLDGVGHQLGPVAQAAAAAIAKWI